MIWKVPESCLYVGPEVVYEFVSEGQVKRIGNEFFVSCKNDHVWTHTRMEVVLPYNFKMALYESKQSTFFFGGSTAPMGLVTTLRPITR